MFLLILLWALIGLCLGLLTLPARLHPPMCYGWLILPATGMTTAIIVGFTGLFLLGKDVTTPLVLWVTIVSLISIPRLWMYRWLLGHHLKQKTTQAVP